MHDRRKHRRYPLDQNCFLTHSNSVGTIVDIGMGGLSCVCLEENKCDRYAGDKEIDIFCGQAILFNLGLSIKVIDSVIVLGKFDSGLEFRQCHAKFNHLEHDQKNQLEEIILLHTTLSISESESISSSV